MSNMAEFEQDLAVRRARHESDRRLAETFHAAHHTEPGPGYTMCLDCNIGFDSGGQVIFCLVVW